MSDPPPLVPMLPESFDGFHLELDPERQRADVILDRPPLNIVTMAEREQMRAVFEALDADARIRVVVLRVAGEHFSSGGEISGFLDASPEHVSRLAWNIAAPARCRKPVIAASRGYCFGVGFELALACDFRIVSECHVAVWSEKSARRWSMLPFGTRKPCREFLNLAAINANFPCLTPPLWTPNPAGRQSLRHCANGDRATSGTAPSRLSAQ